MKGDNFSESGKQLVALTRGTYLCKIESARDEMEKMAATVSMVEKALDLMKEGLTDDIRLELQTMAADLKRISENLDRCEESTLAAWGANTVFATTDYVKKQCETAYRRHGKTISIDIVSREEYLKTGRESDRKRESERSYEEATYSIDGEELTDKDLEAMKRLTREA